MAKIVAPASRSHINATGSTCFSREVVSPQATTLLEAMGTATWLHWDLSVWTLHRFESTERQPARIGAVFEGFL